MANFLRSFNHKESSKSSISSSSSEASSDESSQRSSDDSSKQSMEKVNTKKTKRLKKKMKTSENVSSTSTEQGLAKRKKFKRRKRTGKLASNELTKTENLLQEVLGNKVPVTSNSKEIKSTSKINLIDAVGTKKKKITKFRFPKSKLSNSGQFSHVKSRYLDVFNKTEKPKINRIRLTTSQTPSNI